MPQIGFLFVVPGLERVDAFPSRVYRKPRLPPAQVLRNLTMANYSQRPGPAASSKNKSSYDPFASLATPSSSNPSSRSLTPSNQSRSQASGNQSGPDAFSSLLGPSFSTTSNAEKLSLAERQAAARREQQAKLSGGTQEKQGDPAVWSGLDLLGQPSLKSTSQSSPAFTNQSNNDDTWLFDHIEPATTQKSNPAKPPTSASLEDDWGLSDFAGPGQSSTRTESRTDAPGKHSIFDAFDDDNLLTDSFGEQSVPQAVGTQSVDADDDILGELSKPVTAKPTPPPQPVRYKEMCPSARI